MDAYEAAKTILAHAPFATEVVDENGIDTFVESMESACDVIHLHRRRRLVPDDDFVASIESVRAAPVEPAQNLA